MCEPGSVIGDEMLAGLVRADGLGYAIEEILLEDVRLERAAGFARHDENRLRDIDCGFDGLDLRGIGGIEHVKFGEAGDIAERELEDFDAEARSAHAEQHRVLETGVADFAGNFLKLSCERRAVLP